MSLLTRLLFTLVVTLGIAAGLDVFNQLHRQPKEAPAEPIVEIIFPPPQSIGSVNPPQDKPQTQPVPSESKSSRQSESKAEPENTQPLGPSAEILPLSPPLPIPLADKEFYDQTSRAVVQIFCSGREEIFAASGVIVNARGLVLTNGHVAEIIKRIGQENCQIRAGSPAEKLGGVEVVFTADTSLKIKDTKVPQRDFAFLKIVEPQREFSQAEADPVYQAQKGEWLFTLGYPSEFLQAITASINSNLVFSKLTVEGVIDVDTDLQTSEGYLFRGGIILQQGSSGTAIFSAVEGKAVGLIFATTKGKTTEERDGVALAMYYIDQILKLETKQGLEEFIASH